MSFDINRFKSEINNQGSLAQPNKFRMIISGNVLGSSAARALAFLINQTIIPGRNLTTNEIRTHGPIRKAPYVSLYDDLQVSIYCTNNNLFPRDLFEEWQSSIINTHTGNVSYYDQYVSDILLEQYNDRGDVIYAIKFIDAYPVLIAPLTLDLSATGAFHNLQVTFTYRKWHLYPIPLSPFGAHMTINSLYPNVDIAGAVDQFGMAIISRSDGQLMNRINRTSDILGNEW